MGLPARDTQGYSLIELLMVLAIVAILTVLSVSMIGNRRGAAVRSLLDETEGALSNARSAAVGTSRDTALDNPGSWTAANPVILAFGDASLTDAQIMATANGMMSGTQPDPAVPYSQTVTVALRLLPNDTSQSRARLVVVGSGDWATAMLPTSKGTSNQDITTVAPFNGGAATGFNGILVDANNFFNPGTGTTRQVVSGNSQRFTTLYFIQIVGTLPGLGPVPGGPMGLIVMLANGSSIYKFYNPGVLEGNGLWRRL